MKARASATFREQHTSAAMRAHGKITAEEIRMWKSAFDPAQVPTETFLEMWKTRMKDPDPVTGMVRFDTFKLFDWQTDVIKRARKRWKKRRAYKLLVPKSRTRGVSQLARSWLGFERVLRVPGYETTLIAQDNDAAQEHLGYLSEFYGQIPKGVLPAVGIRKLRSNSTSFVFRHGDFRKSRVDVRTAKKSGLGRGKQNNAIHETERPHWPEKAKADRSAFLRNCADVAGNVIFDESTVMGFDEFYDDCMTAQEGRGGYELLFLPSHGDYRNRLNFDTTEQMENFRGTLGEDDRYGGLEEHAVFGRVVRYHKAAHASESDADQWALEFLHWRRARIDDDCKRVQIFHREEPTTLEEAFQGSGRQVFEPEIMESWSDAAKRMEGDGKPGMVHHKRTDTGERILFQPRRDGELTVFKPPTPGGLYCFGADVASGRRYISGSTDEADFSTMTVKEAYSGRTVARVRAHIFPKPFAELILKLAVYYNKAKGFVEINYPTVVAFMVEDDAELIETLPTDVLLTSDRKVRTDTGFVKEQQFGWNTSRGSKEYMAGTVNKFLMEIGADLSGDREGYIDFLTLDEMRRFVYTPNGGMEAERGHDDLVISEGLCLIARDEVLSMAPKSSAVPQEQDPWVEAYRRLEAQRVDKQSGYAEFPHPNRPGETIKVKIAGKDGFGNMPGY